MFSSSSESVTVVITDRCGDCDGLGDLVFSPQAFMQLAQLEVGRIQGMTWSFDYS
ncbi:hypothetical protein SCHPADRAFT_900861 [Schizopora paradoxa]|uniref:RlpA-like protein double-psi beta-barrel domain-containing protein n=1 Tax=Schizopora paradoxa TaxID=27342 RepID=A0A0H2S6D5_9AGAM|nr:hypothetical protein SCHPADRAFT_900861 [Schizopora paradoxa]